MIVRPFLIILFILPLLAISARIYSQDLLKADSEFLNTISIKNIDKISARYDALSGKVRNNTKRFLEKMEKEEHKLGQQMPFADSILARQVLSEGTEYYKELKGKLSVGGHINLSDYIPGFDSLCTGVSYLKQKAENYSSDFKISVSKADMNLRELKTSVQKANEIQALLKVRYENLKNAAGTGKLSGSLLGMNKKLYYYQQQLINYKEVLRNPDKLERLIITQLMRAPGFKSFFKENSQLTALFGTPAGYSESAELATVQTKNSLQQVMGQRFGKSFSTSSGTAQLSAILQQQLQGIQSQINKAQQMVAKKLPGIPAAANSDMVMPSFKPNGQRTKQFLKRIEYGFDLQTTKAAYSIPSYADLAITAGYKISDVSIAGFAISYKMGFGKPINHIQISNEGVGLRSFLDVKMKGSLWISGGGEFNYMRSFKKFSSLEQDIGLWQKSALLGISKKYKISGNKMAKIQILFDFLYQSHLPASQPVIVRTGYTF